MLELGIENKSSYNAEDDGKKVVDTTASSSLALLKGVLSAFESMVESVVLKFTKKQISAQVIDAMHVCLCDLVLDTALFDHYRCDHEMMLTLPLKAFNAVLRNTDVSSPNSSLLITAMEVHTKKTVTQKENDADGNETEVKKEEIMVTAHSLDIVNSAEASFFKNKISLLECEKPEYMMPDPEFTSIIEVSSEGFRMMRNMTSLSGTKVCFKVHKDEFIIDQEAEGNQSTIVFRNSDSKSITISSTEPVDLVIAKQYLETLSKVFSHADKMTISLVPENPILFELSLSDFGYMNFFIAPQAD